MSIYTAEMQSVRETFISFYLPCHCPTIIPHCLSLNYLHAGLPASPPAIYPSTPHCPHPFSTAVWILFSRQKQVLALSCLAPSNGFPLYMERNWNSLWSPMCFSSSGTSCLSQLVPNNGSNHSPLGPYSPANVAIFTSAASTCHTLLSSQFLFPLCGIFSPLTTSLILTSLLLLLKLSLFAFLQVAHLCTLSY